jgi:predicted dehydrogenase
LAHSFGAEVVNISKGEDAVSAADHFTRGRGVDGVLITAATKSNKPVHQAAQMCRKRGRIILVGVTGLELHRDDFYEKELTFQVSCSYGPGRYDQNYEQKGHDYPLGFVRWTEQRNFEAVLDMMAESKLNVKPLITHRFPFHEAEAAYDILLNDKSAIGILFEYDKEDDKRKEKGQQRTIERASSGRVLPVPGSPVVGCIGAGNFAKHILLPSLKRTSARLKLVADLDPVASIHSAKKYGFEYSGTDYKEILEDSDINTVFITTRHDSHARFASESLEANKNVYVEKPLALTLDELNKIQSSIVGNQSSILMVGFNRRFAPHIVKMKSLLEVRKQHKSFIFTINAGSIPADHWAQDPEVGGGRIIGEACHFIDLMRFLSGSPIVEWSVQNMGDDTLKDKVTINLSFKDNSFGSIHYLANGSKRFPKERVEVFCGGSIIQLDNFRKMNGYSWPGFKKMNFRRQDKGHKAEVNAFIKAVKNGTPSPILFNELYEVSKVAIEVANSI